MIPVLQRPALQLPSLQRPVLVRPRPTRERLRVAIVAETFLPAMNGVTNSVLRLVEHLEAVGHEAMVIAPGPGVDHIGSTPVMRVPSVGLPSYAGVRIGSPSARLTSALRRFSPDVVHLAAPSVLGVAGLRAARRLDVPTVAIYQTDLVGFARRYGLASAQRPLWSWIRWIHERVDLTLAPSTSARWTLAAHGIGNVACWRRGVDLTRFHPDHRCSTLRHELAPNGEIIVGYIGRLAKEKQVERLSPVTKLPGVKVVVVGDGPERARLECRLPRARFVGFREGAELGRFHASLDVFAHTGLDETFCQAVQEALASGVPAVVPAAGGPIDLVAHGVNGYLWSPEQPEMLVGAVGELADSPMVRRRMGRAARESVEGRSWANVFDELIGHYRTVAGIRVLPAVGVAS